MLAFLIPTKDRARSLDLTLARVRRAARAADEIIVCDQSATAARGDERVRVLHRPDIAGLPAARNALLAAATAQVVCFLDDDTSIAGDFGEQLERLARSEPELDGWGPVVECRPLRTRRLHRLAHLGVFADQRRLLGSRRDRRARALFGCCFAVRRRAALRHGFDARRRGYALGEDLDFFLRLGRPLRFASQLRAIHRRDGADRASPRARGRAKAEFLVWLARRHGGRNPATLLHLLAALVAASTGRGEEPGSAAGVWDGCARWLA